MVVSNAKKQNYELWIDLAQSGFVMQNISSAAAHIISALLLCIRRNLYCLCGFGK